MKKTLISAVAILLVLALWISGGAGETVTGEFGLWNLHKNSRRYIANIADTESDTVLLAVSGSGWYEDRLLVNQPELAELNVLYVQSIDDEAYGGIQDGYAKYVVKLLNKVFPNQKRVALYGYSRGGYFLNSLYLELKADREILFAWANDAIPQIGGFPDIEADGIPVCVTWSNEKEKNITTKTKEYGDRMAGALLLKKMYDTGHNFVEIAAAKDMADILTGENTASATVGKAETTGH